MKVILSLFIILNCLSSHAIIFGKDDRQDVIQSARANRLGRSVAMMMADVFVTKNKTVNSAFDLDFVLATDPYNVGLCKEEKFSNQHLGYTNCSGFLIAEDIIVTAGHCTTFKMEVLDRVSPAFCTTFKWVFDYKMQPGGVVQLQNIPASNVYTCKQVIHSEHLAYMSDHHGNFVPPVNGHHGTDFAIIKLDRAVVGRKPLKLSSGSVYKNDPVMVIGYPLALPMKFAEGKVLDENNFSDFIVTDLDIVGGNSGSPVFNASDEVIGVAVRSFPYEDTTYLPNRKCSKLNVCEAFGEGDCIPSRTGEVLGTHVDRIEHVQKWLKSL